MKLLGAKTPFQQCKHLVQQIINRDETEFYIHIVGGHSLKQESDMCSISDETKLYVDVVSGVLVIVRHVSNQLPRY